MGRALGVSVQSLGGLRRRGLRRPPGLDILSKIHAGRQRSGQGLQQDEARNGEAGCGVLDGDACMNDNDRTSRLRSPIEFVPFRSASARHFAQGARLPYPSPATPRRLSVW